MFLLLLLYLIEILHQTTTSSVSEPPRLRLYLIEILHQTTTFWKSSWISEGCILLKFYIKPQLYTFILPPPTVVSYWNSTSNHNSTCSIFDAKNVVSYWNSTSNHNLLQEFVNCWRVVSYWNSTSNHNRDLLTINKFIVVSYWNSTSNHNKEGMNYVPSRLYLIEILHQTTTVHEPCFNEFSCILLKFYIKPQQPVIR